MAIPAPAPPTSLGTSNTATGASPVPVTAAPPAEPGYTTTEWWATVLTMFVGLLTTLGVIHVNVGSSVVAGEIQTGAGLAAMVVPAGIYAISRGIRKVGTAP